MSYYGERSDVSVQAAQQSGRCRWLVWRGYGYGDTCCERKAGHGPDDAYCKQHAKMAAPKKRKRK